MICKLVAAAGDNLLRLEMISKHSSASASPHCAGNIALTDMAMRHSDHEAIVLPTNKRPRLGNNSTGAAVSAAESQSKLAARHLQQLLATLPAQTHAKLTYALYAAKTIPNPGGPEIACIRLPEASASKRTQSKAGRLGMKKTNAAICSICELAVQDVSVPSRINLLACMCNFHLFKHLYITLLSEAVASFAFCRIEACCLAFYPKLPPTASLVCMIPYSNKQQTGDGRACQV